MCKVLLKVVCLLALLTNLMAKPPRNTYLPPRAAELWLPAAPAASAAELHSPVQYNKHYKYEEYAADPLEATDEFQLEIFLPSLERQKLEAAIKATADIPLVYRLAAGADSFPSDDLLIIDF